MKGGEYSPLGISNILQDRGIAFKIPLQEQILSFNYVAVIFVSLILRLTLNVSSIVLHESCCISSWLLLHVSKFSSGSNTQIHY